MVTIRPKELLFLLAILLLFSVAVTGCGDATSQRTQDADDSASNEAQTPSTEITDNNSSNYSLSLPQEVKSTKGWAFQIKRVDVLDSIETSNKRYKPENGIFLLLEGTVGNFTDEYDCIHGRDFTLRNGEALGSQNGIRKIVNRSSLNVLNSKDFLPGKRAVNDPQGYGWDLFGCKMRPDEIVQNPVGIQTLLQSGFLLGVSVGLTAVTGHASS